MHPGEKFDAFEMTVRYMAVGCVMLTVGRLVSGRIPSASAPLEAGDTSHSPVNAVLGASQDQRHTPIFRGYKHAR